MGKYKTNEIVLHSDYAELVIYSKDKKNKSISFIDLEDVDYVKKYSWCIRSRHYVGRVENGEIIVLHRILLKCPDDKIIDHINKK